jgi:hypothetical protein
MPRYPYPERKLVRTYRDDYAKWSGQTTLATNTFSDALELRAGFMNINTSLANPGTITIGTSANESNIVPAVPQLSISGAGANAVIARDIIVNNGGQNSAGVRYGNGFFLFWVL